MANRTGMLFMQRRERRAKKKKREREREKKTRQVEKLPSGK
jgi:hypothetical protein